jgi:glutamine amidotransferase
LSSSPIVIVNFGMGNLRSVQKAVERIGTSAVISSRPNEVEAADKIVLPGVGAFGEAMRRLRDASLIHPILHHIAAGKPMLGICLGLQLLFEQSYEDGEHEGLGVLPGKVVRFPTLPGLKVPHMGWNQIRICRPAPILDGTADGTNFYFTHSYYAVPRDWAVVAAETDHPQPFVSMIWRDQIFATQFHPEKSQRAGLALLHKFAAIQ